MTERALETAAAHATRFLRGLGERPVAATAGGEELQARLGGPLPEHPADPAEVVDQLAKLADDGLVASAGPRYFGFVVGGLGANFSALAAARNHVLAQAGWDVERDGLVGAPPVEVVVGAERHVTIDVALRYLGLGSGRARVVPADDQGRMDAAA